MSIDVHVANRMLRVLSRLVEMRANLPKHAESKKKKKKKNRCLGHFKTNLTLLTVCAIISFQALGWFHITGLEMHW